MVNSMSMTLAEGIVKRDTRRMMESSTNNVTELYRALHSKRARKFKTFKRIVEDFAKRKLIYVENLSRVHMSVKFITWDVEANRLGLFEIRALDSNNFAVCGPYAHITRHALARIILRGKLPDLPAALNEIISTRTLGLVISKCQFNKDQRHYHKTESGVGIVEVPNGRDVPNYITWIHDDSARQNQSLEMYHPWEIEVRMGRVLEMSYYECLTKRIGLKTLYGRWVASGYERTIKEFESDLLELTEKIERMVDNNIRIPDDFTDLYHVYLINQLSENNTMLSNAINEIIEQTK